MVKYVRGINLLFSDTAGVKAYFLYNGHGDVVNLTSAAGTVTKTYDYDAFGVERNPSAADANPWRYCGEYFDLETNTYYLRARQYSPATGRFLSEDPAGAGLNWYTYCSNNPVNRIDPSGLIDIMLSYIAEKNDGTATYDYTGGGCSRRSEYIDVTINGTTKRYTIGEKDSVVKTINKQYIIDNEILVTDFGLDATTSTHQEGDKFNSVDHAVMAFGFMFNPKSISDNLEYGANIYKNDDKYTFRDAISGTPAGFKRAARNEAYGTEVAIVHTHAAYDANYDNDNFSQADKNFAQNRGVDSYVITPGGYMKKYSIGAWFSKVKTITDKMPYDPNHPRYKK